MISKTRGLTFIFIFMAGFMATGCGTSRRMESAGLPVKTPVDSDGAAPQVKKMTSGNYLVQKHDCLWAIAGKPGIFGDSLDWPLLFKANRDEIKDPDLIYPDQNLMFERGYTSEEQDQAKRLAMATPKYVPHTKPRETLPLDYF
jgi:hypothetical protein